MNRHELNELAQDMGIDFFGVADLEPFRGSTTIPADLLAPYHRAISLGVALSRDVIDNIVDGPTPHYAHHYGIVNNVMDLAAFRLAKAIQKTGHRALPIPASQTLDSERWLAAISHKAVARMAGLGWQGKSLLLVNPEVGPRLRLITILTDLDLPADRPLPNRCGKCTACSDACPAGAIKGVPFGDGYSSREAAWDAQRCTDWMRAYPILGKQNEAHLICGLCIKACPVGRKAKTRRAAPKKTDPPERAV